MGKSPAGHAAETKNLKFGPRAKKVADPWCNSTTGFLKKNYTKHEKAMKNDEKDTAIIFDYRFIINSLQIYDRYIADDVYRQIIDDIHLQINHMQIT